MFHLKVTQDPYSKSRNPLHDWRRLVKVTSAFPLCSHVFASRIWGLTGRAFQVLTSNTGGKKIEEASGTQSAVDVPLADGVWTDGNVVIVAISIWSILTSCNLMQPTRKWRNVFPGYRGVTCIYRWCVPHIFPGYLFLGCYKYHYTLYIYILFTVESSLVMLNICFNGFERLCSPFVWGNIG